MSQPALKSRCPSVSANLWGSFNPTGVSGLSINPPLSTPKSWKHTFFFSLKNGESNSSPVASSLRSLGTQQRWLWSCFGVFGCPQHAHANTCAPLCPLLPRGPATFGVKGSKQSTATAAPPSNIPPRGSGKDHRSFTPLCSHSAHTKVQISTVAPNTAGIPSAPTPGWQSQSTEILPATGGTRQPFAWGASQKQERCYFPSSILTIRPISSTTSSRRGHGARRRAWAKQVQLGPLRSQRPTAPAAQGWPLSSRHHRIVH